MDIDQSMTSNLSEQNVLRGSSPVLLFSNLAKMP